jgi:hypothetical protein
MIPVRTDPRDRWNYYGHGDWNSEGVLDVALPRVLL